MEQVPTIRLESLTDDQIRAYVIADNRIAEKAGWDKSILAIELQHLLTIDLNFDVTITGFEVAEIDLDVWMKTLPQPYGKRVNQTYVATRLELVCVV
jgi:hypothetical protein